VAMAGIPLAPYGFPGIMLMGFLGLGWYFPAVSQC
jgi:hypothetical protein